MKTNHRIAIGADHGGFDLKERLKEHLTSRGHLVDDCGTYHREKADYPRIAAAVARKISDHVAERGILIDGAGIGSCIVANKFPGVRAALCYDLSSAANSREHNDANVLTLGAGLIGEGLAEQIVDLWLSKSCSVDRHRRRVAMISEIEQDIARGGCGEPATGDSVMERASTVSGDGPACEPPSAINHREAKSTQQAEQVVRENIREAIDRMDLSEQDMERIARRIVQMVGAQGLAAVRRCSCCGAQCNGHCAEKDPSQVRNLIGMGAARIGHGPGGGPIARDVAGYIDHTLLKPEATSEQVERLCKEALEFGFASVCVNPSYVRLCARLLKGSPVRVCSVVGFPLGAHLPEVKATEARRAIREGASEIDMVINIGALKSGDDDLVYRDIKAVVETCQDGRAVCKVIIECALLTDDEKVRACRLAKRARADYVKTSTGFSTGGATAADVALMSEAVRDTRMGVKAAGGIRSYEDVQAMVQAGATRIGASAGVAIVKEAKSVTISSGD